jgi:hypothetical protein
MPCRITWRRRGRARVAAGAWPLVVTALLCGALVAGCGGSSPGSTVSTGSGAGVGSAGAGDSAASSSAAQMHRAGLAFARCMRANGVPRFPDPTTEGGGFYVGSDIDRASPAFRRAQARCHTLMPGGGPPRQTHPSAQTLARFRGIAECMRRHGVPDFPDPRTSVPPNPFGAAEGGVISDIEEVIFVFPSTIDEQAPAFTQAAAACAFPLHNH